MAATVDCYHRQHTPLLPPRYKNILSYLPLPVTHHSKFVPPLVNPHAVFCIPISRVIPVLRLHTSRAFGNNLCFDSPSFSLWQFPARKRKESIVALAVVSLYSAGVTRKPYAFKVKYARSSGIKLRNHHVYIPRSNRLSSRSFHWSLVTSVPFMISVSSSSTLRAARKLFAEPVVCLEHRWTWTASQRRGYTTERPASEKPRRQPPQPVPTTTQLKPRTNPPPPKSQVKPNPSNGNQERPKWLLLPHVLSKRLTNLASQGQLDQAVDMLQSSPLDASNVATWNTLLLHCMMENRFKLGYKLFTDVRTPSPPPKRPRRI